MRRKRPLPPDTRPSWRDPAMPLARNYTLQNGQRLTQVDPDWEQRFRQHLMQTAVQPSYHNDPTYNLRRRQR